MTALIGGFYENEGKFLAAQANDLEVTQSELLDVFWSRSEVRLAGQMLATSSVCSSISL